MAELYGRVDGCSRGRGGSMHLYNADKRFYGGNAIVGGGLPVAVGLALADKMQGRGRVTVCLFGDGAVAEGEFHESLNLAALWQLPILFVCENNRYAMGTALQYTESETNLAQKAQSYHINARQVDGMNVVAVAEAARRDVEGIRSGNGPMFLECLTYRFRAHSMFDAELYRSKEEVEAWKQKDPLNTLQQHCDENWGGVETEAIEAEVAAIVDEAVDFAENSPLEEVGDLEKFVYTPEEEK
jgi:TPP-dependent pyruvate/acetoin dehydrogenase alpha subunit